MDIESGLGRIYKKKYCEGSYDIYARYKIAKTLGREKVPVDLYPNMFEKAENIISQS